MIEYIIVSQPNIHDFVTEVNRNLSKGYKLYGDAINGGMYQQAMIRNKEEDLEKNDESC